MLYICTIWLQLGHHMFSLQYALVKFFSVVSSNCLKRPPYRLVQAMPIKSAQFKHNHARGLGLVYLSQPLHVEAMVVDIDKIRLVRVFCVVDTRTNGFVKVPRSPVGSEVKSTLLSALDKSRVWQEWNPICRVDHNCLHMQQNVWQKYPGKAEYGDGLVCQSPA